MDALMECLPLFGKKANVELGIASALTNLGYPEVVFVIATEKEAKKWKAAIAEELANYPPEAQWLFGTETGSSSTSIFAVFCGDNLKAKAYRQGKGSTPRDCADLSRCFRLLEKFPEWESRLEEVASAYPDSKWPKIIPRWDELKKLDPKDQKTILEEIGD